MGQTTTRLLYYSELATQNVPVDNSSIIKNPSELIHSNKNLKKINLVLCFSCQIVLYFRYFYRLALKQLTHHVISKRTLFGVDPTKILGGDRSKEYSETKVIGY